MTFWPFTEYQNNPAGCISGLRLELQGLGEVHYNLLRYLIRFLVVVAQYERTNKMSPMSLAIVFGPNLFRYWQLFCWLHVLYYHAMCLSWKKWEPYFFYGVWFTVKAFFGKKDLIFILLCILKAPYCDIFIEIWMYLFLLLVNRIDTL